MTTMTMPRGRMNSGTGIMERLESYQIKLMGKAQRQGRACVKSYEEAADKDSISSNARFFGSDEGL